MSSILFVTLLFLPIATIAYLIVFRKSKWSIWFVSTALCSILFYLVMMLAVKFARIESDRSIAKYDLDGDGSYSQGELTTEAKKALDDWASDTGLNLAPITGLFIAPIYSGLWHIIVGVPYLLIVGRRKQNREQNGVD